MAHCVGIWDISEGGVAVLVSVEGVRNFVFLGILYILLFLIHFLLGVVGVTCEASDAHSRPTPGRRHCIV